MQPAVFCAYFSFRFVAVSFNKRRTHGLPGSAFGYICHSHTAQQFQLIAHLSLLVLAVGALVAFVRALVGRIFRFRLRRPAVRQGAPMRSFALRAPPVC